MTETPMVVVLGAGQPFAGTEPSALIQTSGDRRVLDWILDAFATSLESPEIHFVGGYRMDDVVEEYPEIHFSRNENWADSGPVASLLTAPIDADRPLYVCYADTIFEPDVVDELAGTEDVTATVDSSWQARYRERSRESLERAEKVTLEGNTISSAGRDLSIEEADAELTGLIRCSSAAVGSLLEAWNADAFDQTADLPTLLRTLTERDRSVRAVDIGDRWAELETAEDLSRFVLDTKANTLRRLRSMVEQSVILEQVTFTVAEWADERTAIQAEIDDSFEGNVIVRSSTFAEDSWEESNAGRFESVLDVPAGDETALSEAIDNVVASYPDDASNSQVLVQPMIGDVAASGVVMTRTLEGDGPYYVLNYDATTASTESVTDGTGEHLQTAIVRRDLVENGFEGTANGEAIREGEATGEDSPGVQYPSGLDVESLLGAVRELEELIAHDSLDVEFAIDGAGEIYIFQARPMTLEPGEQTVDDATVFGTVDAAREAFVAAQTPAPGILGDRTIYGVMPDWNPAEIIGRQPRRLAASLYRYLVMNDVWATQRAEYGYRDVRPQPLMRAFAGQPYVDVRADCNSFIPASVPDELAERLVNYYLNRLEENPELHDKIEFDVVLTCLTFDWDAQIEPLLDAGFTREELAPLREGLAEITQTAFERIDEDVAAIDRLEARYEDTVGADLAPLETAYHLLEDCRRYGTVPFAHLARTAFVATTLLRSLERIGVLTAAERSAFQNAVTTVARQFERDAYRVSTGEMAWETFVDSYGHLRPGTYDITSPRYDAEPEAYLRPVVENATEPPDRPAPTGVWGPETMAAIEAELEAIGLPADADAFVAFLARAIEAREHAKFVFSRNLSEALELIAEFGEEYGFSREELSHVPIEAYFDLAVNHPPADVQSRMSERIKAGRREHATTRAVELPPLLFEERDFLVFERPAREPNFVTGNTVTADAIELDGHGEDDLAGAIVLVPQADPGYDWLFGHDIAGLITMYGGSNSHMAVRAAEFSLPAAIGVGESRYEQLRRAEVLELDSDGRNIRVIQ